MHVRVKNAAPPLPVTPRYYFAEINYFYGWN